MKRALLCMLLLSPAGARGTAVFSQPSSELTVVLDFKGPHSEQSVQEMQREAQRIIQDSGVHLDWRTVDQAVHHTYADLVVVYFKGRVSGRTTAQRLLRRIWPAAAFLRSRNTTDGDIQPFSEVACDKVAASVRSAMWDGDFANGDLLMGRALGRVLVHELVHMLTKSGEHGREGVQKPSLSGKQLISEYLALSPADMASIRQNYRHDTAPAIRPYGRPRPARALCVQ